MTTAARIGFIGIGTIGLPMAVRLLQAGHDVLACDRNPAALQAFAAAGGRPTSRPGDCAAAEIVVFMVADDAQLADCAHGPDGVLSAAAVPGARMPSVFVVMSTVLPDSVRALAAQAEPLGIGVVDAPVSGGPLAAAAGQLSIMVGGADADVQRADALWAALAKAVHRCGPLGQGALAKIVNNLVGVTTLMLLAEGLQLAQAGGLDPVRLSAVMEASSGRNAVSADWQRGRAVFDDFSADLSRTASFLRTNAKDLQLALTLAGQRGLATPLLRAALTAVAAMDADEMRRRMRSFL